MIKSLSKKEKGIFTVAFTLLLVAILVLAIPSLAFAADLEGLLDTAARWLESILPLLLAIEFIVLFIGIMRFYMTSDSSDKKVAGNKFIVWALIALFVTMAIYGIVAFFQNTVGVTSGGDLKPPQLSEEVPVL